MGFIATVASLVAIWEFLTGENFPQFLTRKGWGITMPSWYYSFVIVFLCIVVMLQTKLTRVVLARRRELVWLEAIADEDDRDTENRIQVFPWDEIEHGPVASLHPSAYEPSIDLKATIQNNTVYTLTITHIDGGVTLRGGNAAVCCTYENRAGEQKSIRIPLNDLTFPVRIG